MHWLAFKYPEVARDTFSIPNEGKTSWVTGVKMKQAGMKSGVPDLFIPVAMQGHNGLFIEMKSNKGRLSTKQKEFQERLRGRNYAVHTCYSFDDFTETVTKYLTQSN